MMANINYNSKSAARIIGISMRQIQYWDEKNIVSPSVRKASGKGTMRLYSFTDLVQLRIVKQFRESNISLVKVKRCLKYLRKAFPKIGSPLAELSFITDGETIFIISDDKKIIIDALKEGQITWHVSLNNVVKTVSENSLLREASM